MIKHNEYFDGNVQSLVLEGHDKPATVGVMAKGEYEFGTAEAERMQVVAGELVVRLPDSADWVSFKSGTEFYVAADSKFQLKVPVDTAYFCVYSAQES